MITVHFEQRPRKGALYELTNILPGGGQPERRRVASFEDYGHGSGLALLEDENGRIYRRAVLYGQLGAIGL